MPTELHIMETEPPPDALVDERRRTPPVLKEFLVGAAGGITQVIIGQPFDIVKVRMQTQFNHNATQVARNIWVHEGPRAFYKGSLPPLTGVGACISIVYSTFHAVSFHLQGPNDKIPLSGPQIYLAGGIAGLANSFISGPVEHIRIRLQTQSTSPNQTKPYSGVSDCIHKILQQGGLRALYRGQSATMLREFGSYGIWFSVYESLLSRVMKRENKPRDDIAGWKIAGCGVVTGCVLWTVNYPFDVVKSKMQADGLGEGRRYKNLGQVVRHTWLMDGWNGFFRGLGPTLLRAVPVSAGTFVVVETARDLLA